MSSHDDHYTGGRQLSWTPIENSPSLWENDGTQLQVGAGHLTTSKTRERCDVPCATADHFAQEVISVHTMGGFCIAGVIVRMDILSDSMYIGAVDPDSGTPFLNKVVGGVQTDGPSGTAMPSWTLDAPHTLKLGVVGADLSFYVDGGAPKVTWHDTSLSGGLYTGHIAWAANGALFYFDDHHGEDDSAPAPTGDPLNLVVVEVTDHAHLTWDPSPGALDYSIYRRTPHTGAAFTPGVSTPIATGITALSYNDVVAPGVYDYQVFGRLT